MAADTLSSTLTTAPPRPRRAVLAGLCASLVGIGLARFAYTPLIPVLIDAAWFSPSEAVQLGAANLAGYLAGALLAGRAAARLGAPAAIRAAMLAATAAFFACGVPLSFLWYFAWRFAAGAAGGVLMALAAPTVLPHVPPARRGLAGGLIFTGVGLGIAASGTLVPLLLTLGLAATWHALGVLALLLTAIAWSGWPASVAAVPPAEAGPSPRRVVSPALWALHAEYALVAVGLVPHMVFLVDFVARGLGRGLHAGAVQWVLFGLGAVLGPVLAGRAADRIGFAAALRLAFVMQAGAAALPLLSDAGAALAASSLVIGAFVPGVVPLVLGRVRELAAPDEAARRAAWAVATIAFALGQAAGGYGFSFLFAATGGYMSLFACAAAAFLLALAVDLAAARRHRA